MSEGLKEQGLEAEAAEVEKLVCALDEAVSGAGRQHIDQVEQTLGELQQQAEQLEEQVQCPCQCTLCTVPPALPVRSLQCPAGTLATVSPQCPIPSQQLCYRPLSPVTKARERPRHCSAQTSGSWTQ